MRTLIATLALCTACEGALVSDDGGTDGGARFEAGSPPIDAAAFDAPTFPDVGPVPAGHVAVTVAVGRGGRSTISCDDGRTWIENRIETAPTVRCWGQPNDAEPQWLDAAHTMPNPNYLECDHDARSVTGLVYHHDAFFRSVGWGTPGRTQRSVDGVDWTEPTPAFTQTYLGLVTLGDSLVAMGTPQPFVSTDEAMTWTMTAGTLGWDAGHVRAATTSSYGAMGSIVFYTDMGMWWSDDRGATFHGPTTAPCDGHDFASGNGITIVDSTMGSMCTTTDGGRTWTTHALGTAFAGNPVWNGHAFHAWGTTATGFAHFSSADGVTWTTTAGTSVALGIVGTTVLGSFVGVDGIWNGGYENQRFFRSVDGDTWTTLAHDGSAFVASHPISQFTSGVVLANAFCTGS